MSPLPDRSFVENRRDSPYEVIIERSRLHNDAVLLSFPDLVSGFSLDLFLPPKRIALNRKRCDRIQLHGIGVFWFCVRQTLPEGQDVRVMFALSKRINQHFRFLHVFEPLLLKPGVKLRDPRNFPLNENTFTINLHSRAKSSVN